MGFFAEPCAKRMGRHGHQAVGRRRLGFAVHDLGIRVHFLHVFQPLDGFFLTADLIDELDRQGLAPGKNTTVLKPI